MKETYILDSDQPTTCPKCGKRTDWTDNANGSQDHECLGCEAALMNTCKTCYWWGQDFSAACSRVDVSTPHVKPMTTFHIEVTADDDQGLNAMLITGPDFGCIHWRKK